jgi:2-amino-4-hydroxy-6-hydroxymethyldihydropteridine diphosphokinase
MVMSDKARRSVAFVAVGSNIEPQRNILAALMALIDRTHVAGSSTFYRTPPIGRDNQPMFVNGVWLIHTDLEPRVVRDDLLRPVERLLDRRRSEDKFASRTIDLDLVLYKDWVIRDADISLPHPDITRPFVHGPILELLGGDRPAIEPGLRDRIVRLLPQNMSMEPPGEILDEFTLQLRGLLA